MKKYRVTYFYLATGMEGMADEEDYGIVEADSGDEAVNKVVLKKFPTDIMYGPNNTYSTRDFFKGCLSTKEVL